MGYKTRGSYGTGSKECGAKCMCILCKRKREEEKKHPDDPGRSGAVGGGG
jgi:hypothetical protein